MNKSDRLIAITIAVILTVTMSLGIIAEEGSGTTDPVELVTLDYIENYLKGYIDSGDSTNATEIRELEERASALETLISQYETRLSVLESDYSAAIAELTASINANKATLTSLNSDIATAKARLTSLEALSETLETHIESLESEMASQKTAVSGLQSKVNEYKTTLANLKSEIDDGQTELQTLQNEVNLLKSALESAGGDEMKFCAVRLVKGNTLLASGSVSESTEIILRSGAAQAVSSYADMGLSDMTSGANLMNGDELSPNHYIIIPRGGDGRGIKAVSTEIWILVRGEYTIG